MSLLAADDSYGVAATLFVIVFLALLAERTRVGRRVSASLISIGAGLVVANAGILPHEAAAYDFVLTFLVPLAIPLLLLKADLRRILTETGPTLIAFSAGAIGTVVGGFLGYLFIDVGPETNKLVGVLSASFIGGSVNFVAVSQIVEVQDASLISAAVAAQGVAAIIFLSLLMLAPRLDTLRRLLPTRRTTAIGGQPPEATDPDSSIPPLLDLSASLTISMVICATGVWLARIVGAENLVILFVTLVAVVLATCIPHPLARLRSDTNVGMLLIYIFFAVMGARSDISLLAGAAFTLLMFLTVLLSCHSLFVLAAAKLFKLDLAEALIGSNACALGPPTAAAAAASQRWHDLVTPGVLCGILDYVIANFIGSGMAYLLVG